jgi:hypothetical protein
MEKSHKHYIKINNNTNIKSNNMNNKNTVTFSDLGTITKTLDGLEIENKEEIQDMRVKLATIWLNHALKMQGLKDTSSKKYCHYAIEEEFILSAIGEFRNARRYLQKAFSSENAEGFGGYVNTTQTRMRK